MKWSFVVIDFFSQSQFTFSLLFGISSLKVLPESFVIVPSCNEDCTLKHNTLKEIKWPSTSSNTGTALWLLWILVVLDGGMGVLVLGLPGQLREAQVLAAFVFFVVRHWHSLNLIDKIALWGDSIVFFNSWSQLPPTPSWPAVPGGLPPVIFCLRLIRFSVTKWLQTAIFVAKIWTLANSLNIFKRWWFSW